MTDQDANMVAIGSVAWSLTAVVCLIMGEYAVMLFAAAVGAFMGGVAYQHTNDRRER